MQKNFRINALNLHIFTIQSFAGRLKKTSFLLLLPLILLAPACNSTKYVPEGEYLLEKVKISKDNKVATKEEIESYLRQKPNSAMLGLFKVQLGIYNLSGNDSSKWTNRMLKKIGDEPVIYNQQFTEITESQIKRLYSNRGYMNAEVSSELSHPKEKTAVVEYNIKANTPYRIKSYDINIDRPEMLRIANDTNRSLIKTGKLFDSEVMDAERGRITNIMRNRGYFNFTKDQLEYYADSTHNSHQADLVLELREQDSLRLEKLFKRYTIRNVSFISQADRTLENIGEEFPVDSFSIENYNYYYEKKRNIRPNILRYNTHLVPGSRYNDRAVERTYSSINNLSAVKYMDISFKEVEDDQLDATITLSPSKLQTISTDVEGTYSAGYWGLGGNLNYGHRNAFKGSEYFTLGGRAAYEYQKHNQHAYELGGDATLKFPRFLLPFLSRETKRNIPAATEISGTYSFRKRPGEYTGIVTGMAYKYNWSERTHIKHAVDVLNLSYVYYPYISDEYREYLSESPYFVYNFQNHLIMSAAYKGSRTGYRATQPLRNYTATAYQVETAGNLLYGINSLLQSPKDENGAYKIFGIRYAQYIKADFNIAHYQNFDQNNQIVYHAAFGLTVPYGNNPLVPFEKRYFSGGPNSVRGWTAYRLGPGTFRSPSGLIDYNTQMGDVKIDLNMEYRAKLFWKLHTALFIDAGNVWTIRNYESQPGGAFQLKNLAKELGIAYGTGLRADFSFFVFRVDLGVKLHDPSLSRTERWRIKPGKNDFALNVAIGYPF